MIGLSLIQTTCCCCCCSSFYVHSRLIKSKTYCEMRSLLVRVGLGFRFQNKEPSWFYRLDAPFIAQPQCGTNSNPRSPQGITHDIRDSIKTPAQKKTTGQCFYIAQRFKMHALAYTDIINRPV